MMKRLATMAVLITAAPVLSAPGGPIDTLQPGHYVCELPGDATGPVGLRQSEESFTVLNASNYASPTGRGTYLLTSDTVTMTSGPKNGQKFRRVSQHFLRKLDDAGKDTALRCIRRVANNR